MYRKVRDYKPRMAFNYISYISNDKCIYQSILHKTLFLKEVRGLKGIIYGIKFINPDTQEKFLKVGIAKYRAGKVGLGVLQRGSSKDFYTPDYQAVYSKNLDG